MMIDHRLHSQANNEKQQSSNHVGGNMIELHKNKQEQNEIVDLITKLSLLTVVCVLFSQLFTIFAAHFWLHMNDNDNGTVLWFEKQPIQYVGLLFRWIEAFVNCITLY